jgi:hypothetical protein
MKNKKLLNTVSDIFGKAIVLTLVYLGVFQDVWMAKNFLYFINFLNLVVATFIFISKEEAIELYRFRDSHIKWSNGFYAWVVILSYISMAWFGSAFIWFVTWAAFNSIKKEINQK